MDDYRDIGAKDFERYEKIRARIGDLVEFFDLITNSTPGTLQIDPVQVVYDLASESGPTELTVETAQFERKAGGITGVSSDPLTSTPEIIANNSTFVLKTNGGFQNDGIRRLRAIDIQAENTTGALAYLYMDMVEKSGPFDIRIELARFDVGAGATETFRLFTTAGENIPEAAFLPVFANGSDLQFRAQSNAGSAAGTLSVEASFAYEVRLE